MEKRFYRKKGKLFSPPLWSMHIYVKIDSSMVHIFRFLLEAEDNLGIMTVVDRWGAVLKVRCSPHQRKELLRFLDGMKETVSFDIIDCYCK